LCKQDCPYVQGNVFTAGDKKFCANCYRLLAEKQKERQQQAAAAAQAPAQPPAAANPASPRVAPPAGWANRNTVTHSAPPVQEEAQPARQRPTVGAGAAPTGFRAQSQVFNNPPPTEALSTGSGATATTRRAPPSWQTRGQTVSQPEPPAATSEVAFSPREAAKPVQQPAPVQPTKQANTPAPQPAAASDDEPKPKKRLIDQMQDIKIEDTTFSRFQKSKETVVKKVEAQPYRGGPWLCPGCKSRQIATTCQMCGHASPVIVPLPGQQEKAKKVIDPDDPFSHIELTSWDESPGHIKRWWWDSSLVLLNPHAINFQKQQKTQKKS